MTNNNIINPKPYLLLTKTNILYQKTLVPHKDPNREGVPNWK